MKTQSFFVLEFGLEFYFLNIHETSHEKFDLRKITKFDNLIFFKFIRRSNATWKNYQNLTNELIKYFLNPQPAKIVKFWKFEQLNSSKISHFSTSKNHQNLIDSKFWTFHVFWPEIIMEMLENFHDSRAQLLKFGKFKNLIF